jgi:transcription initiation factor TFIIB
MSEPSIDDFRGVLNDVLDHDQNTSENEHRLAAKSQLTFGSGLPEDVLLEKASEEVDQVVRTLDLPPSVAEMATQLFGQFVASESMDGRSLEPYAAAVVYCACKINEEPVHPDDVVRDQYDLLTESHILRRVKHIASTVGLDAAAFFESKHFVPQYCEELELPAEIEERAVEIVERCEGTGLTSGKSPSAWAGAAVYNAALENGREVTQQEISRVAQTTEVTIRKRYQEQRDLLRATEIDGTDPQSILETASSQLNVEDTVEKAAAHLLSKAEHSGDESCTEKRASALAVAALNIASQKYSNEIGYQVLRQYTAADSDTIRRLERRLESE